MRRRIACIVVTGSLLALAPLPARSACFPVPPTPLCLTTGTPPPPPPGISAPADEGCQAIDVYVWEDLSSLGAPVGSTTSVSKSVASVAKGTGFGSAHADAHKLNVGVSSTYPFFVGAGAVESQCNVTYGHAGSGYFGSSNGQADVKNLSINLDPYVPGAYITADVLKENGSSTLSPPGGSNTADIVNLVVSIPPATPILVSQSQLANSCLFLPGNLGEVCLNEQMVTPVPGCPPRYEGDALRVILNNPSIPTPIVQVLVSWVSTGVC